MRHGLKTIFLIYIVLLLYFFAATPFPAAAASDGASFKATYGNKFSSRKGPAAASTQTEEELRAKGYINIGTLYARRKLETCYAGTCQPEKSDIAPTRKVLITASKNGGDIVVLSRNNAPSSYEEERSTCRQEGKVTVPGVDPGSGLKTGSHFTVEQCIEWDRYMVTVRVEISEGTAWRLEPGFLASSSQKTGDAGWAPVKTGGNWKFIDPTGKVMLDTREGYVGPFSEGLAMASFFRGSLTGYIDSSGHKVVPMNFNGGGSRFSEGLAIVAHDNYCGYIDHGGQYVIEPQIPCSGGIPEHSRLGSLSHFSEGLAAMRRMEGDKYKYGYIDKKGAWAIEPRFLYALPFSEGLAPVTYTTKGEKYRHGYIDKTGKLVIRDLGEAEPFSEGLAVASKKTWGKKGYVDKTGKFVIKPKFKEALRFSEGLAFVTGGYIDKKGKFVIKSKDYFGGVFSGGLAPVVTYCNDKKSNYNSRKGCPGGYINREGQFVLPPTYEEVLPFSSKADLEIAF